MSIALRIAEPRVSQILSEVYGISGKIDFLPGEIDLNYKVEGPDGEIYVLKISRPGFDKNYFDFRDAILQHLKSSNGTSNSPELVLTLNGNTYSEFQDDSGRTRRVRMLRWIEGRLWSKVNPKSDSLRYSLGKCAGATTSQLSNFNHPYAQRKFPWDIAQAQWTEKHLDLFHSEQRGIIEYFHNLFEVQKESYIQLRKSVIHNDANDNNIIVSHDLRSPRVESIIDFGDAIYTQTINDLAVCCAYAIMDFPDPLEAALPIISGYHQNFALQEEELSHLYMLIAMRLVISVTKSAINKNEEPDNEYLLISEKSAWDLLYRWKKVSLDFAHYCFRHACGFTPHPKEYKFQNWAKSQKFEIQDIIPRAGTNEVLQLDLSVGSTFTGHEKEIADLELFDFKINRLQKEHPNKILAGGYCEPRVLYTSSAYEKHGNSGSEHRTVHVGIDFWYPAGTEITALEDGVVVTSTNDSGDKEYGGLVILKHQLEDFHFYSLYAHNTPESATQHKIGDHVKKGQKIAELGNFPENGNWVPHLHFQIMLSMLDYKLDFPGVVYANQLEIWKSFVP
ncbi:MAG: peptidoglycan DD-metalloendopeptidase family protein, partial [Flavobacteriaceae bacterium]|nr:peptidoglycan DD-metalloendopeptidase family protein [Flavobacteriaceae bacterium]